MSDSYCYPAAPQHLVRGSDRSLLVVALSTERCVVAAEHWRELALIRGYLRNWNRSLWRSWRQAWD